MRTHVQHEPGTTQAPRSTTQAAPVHAAETAAGGSPLDGLAQRANAGPHATSLAALGSVVAQRECAGCAAVKRGTRQPVQRAASDGGGLPAGLRAGLESLSGHDLSDVRVHYGSARPAQLQAHAYAQGSDIHVAAGQEHHLPHEGWHVIQQRQNRVKPTLSVGGTAVNDDARLEREADVMGERALRAGGTAQRRARPSAAIRRGAVQRKLAVGAEIDEDDLTLTTLIDYYENGGYLKKTTRKHPLYKALQLKAFIRDAAELLEILQEWAGDDEDRPFRTWLEAVQAAKMHLNAQRSSRNRSADEQSKRNAALTSLLKGNSGSRKRMLEEDLDSSDEERMGGLFEPFRDEASQSTDAFDELLKGKETIDKVPLPVKRRKLHKGGISDLPGRKVRYRSYTGSISPKPNAFVLGELEQDYGPLLKSLVAAIALETKDFDEPLDDRDVAALFLQEFEGKDAFADFSPEAQKLAHKVISVMFFAELSRHSIALLTAAAAFSAVATRGDDEDGPGLVESFQTGSDAMRPLFAGKGGPSLMRGESTSDVSKDQVRKRRVRAMLDIENLYTRDRRDDEDQLGFVRRRTLQYILNLAGNTDEQTMQLADLSGTVYKYLAQVRPPAKKGATPLETLTALGFAHHPMAGDENDCAIYTLYDQLTRRGIGLGTFQAFRDHLRNWPGVAAFGSMIDILNGGGALLAAVQDYLQNVMHANVPALTIDVWSATGDGGLMDFQGVASQPSPDGTAEEVLTFYFNGVNHFDSLTGGLSR
ncbi:MAG TPA: DUF4157 domain-containing protein [Longimicrobium sp.]|jgi:hypothetical protein